MKTSNKLLIFVILIPLNLLFSADVNYFGVVKSQHYRQTSSSTPTILSTNGYGFNAFVIASGRGLVTNASVKPSNTTPLRWLTNEVDEMTWRYTEFFNTQQALDNVYPVGTLLSPVNYTVTMYTVNDGIRSANLRFFFLLSPISWPTTPQILNYSAAQAIDTTQDFVLQWNDLGGSTLDIVQVLIIDVSSNILFASPAPFQDGALNGASRSVTIPANTLPPGASLEGHIIIARPGNPDTSYGGATGIPTLAKDNAFPINTVTLKPSIEIAVVASGTNSSLTFPIGSAITNRFSYSPLSSVSNIELYVNGSLHFRAVKPPYDQIIINNATAGNYSLQAIITDTNGFKGTSAPVVITVTNFSMTAIITNGSEWRYYSSGGQPPNDSGGKKWNEEGYDDGFWAVGYGELGFGDQNENNPERTLIYGGPDNDRYRAIYFRKTFNIERSDLITNVVAYLLRDDGAVVYINGVEIWRDNMPSGSITYSVFASSAASDDGTVYYSKVLNPTVLKDGVNTVAVEVHQSSSTSSDLSFDFMLWCERTVERPVIRYIRNQHNFGVAWTSAGFRLQQSTNLTLWTDVAGNPQGMYQVTIIPSETQLYFRLIKSE